MSTKKSCAQLTIRKRRALPLVRYLCSAEQIGVTLVGAWVDAPAHTVYLVVETDSVEKLSDLFYPALSVAHADIRPVEDALALFKRRFAES